MGRCCSVDHFAKDHMLTDITTCNIEEPQQQYGLEKVRKKVLRGIKR